MTVLDDTGSPPLAREVATELLRRGWHPLPLPPRAKSQPPAGYTGRWAPPITAVIPGRLAETGGSGAASTAPTLASMEVLT